MSRNLSWGWGAGQWVKEPGPSWLCRWLAKSNLGEITLICPESPQFVFLFEIKSSVSQGSCCWVSRDSCISDSVVQTVGHTGNPQERQYAGHFTCISVLQAPAKILSPVTWLHLQRWQHAVLCLFAWEVQPTPPKFRHLNRISALWKPQNNE